LSSGEYVTGHNVETDYFAQDQYKALNADATILDDLASVAPRASNTELRTILGSFLFSEDDVFKRIGVLSGGERNRYALARMLMMPGNFLLLDEPTNHLDIRAKDVLLTALRSFTGTVVFVSHDRYFLDELATQVIEVADGAVTAYPDNYEDYLRRKSGGEAVVSVQSQSKAASEPKPVHKPKPQPQSPPKSAPATDDKSRRLNPIKLRQIRERQRSIEDEVTRLEVEIADFEQALSSYRSAEQSMEIAGLLESRRADMTQLLAEWEEVSATIDANR
jgi:ATP-binding cassette, subfamily F, member 3